MAAAAASRITLVIAMRPDARDSTGVAFEDGTDVPEVGPRSLVI